MTTTAGHSFYIGPIGFFYNPVNDTGSGEPLVSIYFLWRVRLDRIIIKFFLKSKIFKNLKYFFITV
jgi:hypothetical protein